MPEEKKRWLFEAFLVRVIDGDTIEVTVELRQDKPFDLGFGISQYVPSTEFKTKLRLRGVDTHEIFGVPHDSEEYKKGMEAKKFVEEWFEEHGDLIMIETFKQTFDRYEAHVWEYPYRDQDESSLAKALKDAGHDKGDA